jgi:hypothetical protein
MTTINLNRQQWADAQHDRASVPALTSKSNKTNQAILHQLLPSLLSHPASHPLFLSNPQHAKIIAPQKQI